MSAVQVEVRVFLLEKYWHRNLWFNESPEILKAGNLTYDDDFEDCTAQHLIQNTCDPRILMSEPCFKLPHTAIFA